MVDSQALALAYTLGGLLALLLLPAVLRNRDKPGASGLLFVVAGSVLLALGTAVGVSGATDWHGLLEPNLKRLSASLAAIGYFLIATEYTGTVTTRKWLVGLLVIEPVAMQLLAWTNPSHHLVYRAGTEVGSAAVISAGYGPAFWVHAAFAYTLVVVGLILMALEVLRSHGIRRQQSVALVAAAIPPVATATYATFVGETTVDPTPFGAIAMVFILAWALFRAQFLDIVPIAREQAMEEMEDMVVTLDDEDRVIDCNAAAREFVGVGPNYVGMHGADFFAAFPEMVEEYGEVDATDTEASVTTDGQDYHFDIRISPIENGTRGAAGRVIVFRDITEQKEQERELREREQRLREREQRLDLTRQILTRVLRHNIRNDLQVIRMRSEMAADGDKPADKQAEIVVSKATDLMETSEKAREIDRVLEQEQTVQSRDVAETMREIVAEARVEHPGVSFALDCPDHCPVETIPSLRLVFENLVENAAEHNSASPQQNGDAAGHNSEEDPTVETTVTVNEETVVVTISDNGPGIPEQELTVLREGEETALEHGSGVGLWLIDWVIDNSTAIIDYETSDDGTTATVTIPRNRRRHDETSA